MRRVSTRTKAIVVEISRSPEPSSSCLKASRPGTCSGSARTLRAGSEPPSFAPMLLQVADLVAVLAGLQERHRVDLGVGHRDVEAIAEGLEILDVHLLRLVRRHAALARRAHAESLHRLREDHGRAAGVLHGPVVGRVDLHEIVAAAIEPPDLLVGHVGDHLLQLRVLAEEILAGVGAAEGLAGLVLAVDGLFHDAAQQSLCRRRRAADPSASPTAP